MNNLTFRNITSAFFGSHQRAKSVNHNNLIPNKMCNYFYLAAIVALHLAQR